jgi:ABA4-like protein
VRDAQKHDIPHWAIVPNLILTFLFGPVGLLLYFVIRSLKGRKLSLYSAGQ